MSKAGGAPSWGALTYYQYLRTHCVTNLLTYSLAYRVYSGAGEGSEDRDEGGHGQPDERARAAW